MPRGCILLEYLLAVLQHVQPVEVDDEVRDKAHALHRTLWLVLQTPDDVDSHAEHEEDGGLPDTAECFLVIPFLVVGNHTTQITEQEIAEEDDEQHPQFRFNGFQISDYS